MIKPKFDPDFFRARCRKLGVKITPQRMVLYRELLNASDHPSADVLFRRVRKKLPHISFDTVNRTLLSFSFMGLIRTAASMGNTRRYDALLASHHHFHCRCCNRIIDFQNPAYDLLAIPDDLGQGLQVMHKMVVLEGICDRCGKKDKPYQNTKKRREGAL